MQRIDRSAYQTLIPACFLGALMLSVQAGGQDKPAEEAAIAQPVPAAIIPFHDKGGKDGSTVTDLLFAELVSKPEMYLVDREDLSKTMAEQDINLSGAVDPNQAVRVGQLVGAKILITGSVVNVGGARYVIAKIIGTETSRVLGASVKGQAGDPLPTMVEQLATEIASKISTGAAQLVAKPASKEDRLKTLEKRLGDKKRPSLWITVKERHVSQFTIDPAAQTELEFFAKSTDFPLVMPVENEKPDADIQLIGEGFSEFAGRVENIISVKARLEVKAVERRTGKVLAVDRQTTVVLDRTEQIAGKTALQEAAAKIAERMLPRLVAGEAK